MKSREGRCVVANAPFESVEVNGVPDTSALAQNSRHAVAFVDACSKHPFDNVYEQLVSAYGGLNQKRAHLHVRRIKNIR